MDIILAMDYLCCPRCHGTLEEDPDEGNCFSCAACGVLFPMYEGHANFAASGDLDEFSQWQRDIYDGKVGSVCPPDYADPEGARMHNEHCMDIAGRVGLIQPNWKGLKSRQIIDRLLPREGELVLDVGCGLGTLLSTLHRIYRTRGVGIDFSHAGMKAAISSNPCDNDYHVADALMLPFRDESFDLAVSYDVIEHVTDPRRFVSEMSRVLKPGGRLLIYTPSRSDRWTWHWWERLFLRGRYNLGVDNLAGHDPDMFLMPDELSGYLADEGLVDIHTEVFHTLFTLILDEVYPMFIYRLFDRPALLKAVFRLLETADAPVADRGFGNGFFALAWKDG
ncbi:MAG: methyltransferase domain-containing protein [Actinobacteria bacterium]|nr:methyltransferase domain-containing protein [Actinomycetota bacterium]MCG2818053.1 methyltransferase domain-containing protein [Actinomycetes bacterium]MBU4219156.1 methyltransferase domain-containing protein [Actinomycetota bacterium]MBU4357644.1 methyltransferase domain-containing protein [Actinomycetota bacterium]MBU4392204.1 methyltransferase domain-containing protein [Actinomycetota bacterium]